MSWSDGAHDIQHPLCHKRHVKWCAAVSAPLSTTIGLCPSEAKNDECREGVRGRRFGWEIGSAIKISCPSYLGPN